MPAFDIVIIILNLSGLLLAALGAFIAARAVIISDRQADAISGTCCDNNTALKEALLAQSRNARNGLVMVMLGALLQVASILAPLLRWG